MNKIEDKNGFASMEIIIALVVIVLIGLVGWFIYKEQQKPKSQPVSTLNSASIPTTSAKNSTNPYYNWPTYNSKLQGLSFKYPLGWFVTQNANADITFISNYQKMYNESNSPPNYQLLWISSWPQDIAWAYATLPRLEAGKAPNGESGKPTKLIIKNGNLEISTYTYLSSGAAPILEAFWSNSSGKRYYASTSSGTSTGNRQVNQENMVANLKLILATVKFTNQQ